MMFVNLFNNNNNSDDDDEWMNSNLRFRLRIIEKHNETKLVSYDLSTLSGVSTLANI